ncbi:MAG TPA: hypothetical protein IAC49_06675, partial [Candidatus Ventricola intestinavium]|nr:hypothetical protein [Candidatus Ventricola intestinavium]
ETEGDGPGLADSSGSPLSPGETEGDGLGLADSSGSPLSPGETEGDGLGLGDSSGSPLSPGETEGDGSASGGLATLQNPEEQEIKSIVRHSRPAIMRLNDLISFPPICRSFPVP